MTPLERFMTYVVAADRDRKSCWLWTGTPTERGYGRFRLDGRNRPAHAVSYELHVGPIADGLEPDHLCRNRACVNPAHLEVVTHRENVLRGSSPIAAAAASDHCVHGHPLSEENTYANGRGRQCKTCARERSRAKLGDPAFREARRAYQRSWYAQRKTASA